MTTNIYMFDTANSLFMPKPTCTLTLISASEWSSQPSFPHAHPWYQEKKYQASNLVHVHILTLWISIYRLLDLREKQLMLPLMSQKEQQEPLLAILKVIIDPCTTKTISKLIFTQWLNLNLILILLEYVVLIFYNLGYVRYVSVSCAGACQK